MKNTGLFLLLILGNLCIIGYGQTPCDENDACDCDYKVGGTSGTEINVNTSSIPAGSKISVLPGSYTSITFRNLTGTAANPIVIENCGGLVIAGTDSTNFGIKIAACRYIVLSGAGDSSEPYGFEIASSSDSGLKIESQSSDLEIHHVEIHDTGFAGIFGWSTNSNDFVQENTLIHHNYIHDTGAEGIYLGNTNGTRTDVNEYHHLEIDHNIVENTGWDGIQLARATEDVLVHHNIINGTGLTATSGEQDKGLQISHGCQGLYYDNYIANTGSHGLLIAATNIKVYNNVVVNTGVIRASGAIYHASSSSSYATEDIVIANNTFYNTHGYLYESSNPDNDTYLINNIAYDSAGAPAVVLSHGDTSAVTQLNNLYSNSLAALGFVDAAAGNYHLIDTSAAVDAGTHVSTYGIDDDYDGVSRPQGSAYDIGAFEYKPTETEGARLSSSITGGDEFKMMRPFPNPTKGRFYLVWPSFQQLTIFTQNGTPVTGYHMIDYGNDVYLIDLPVPPGLYYVRVKGRNSAFRLIVTR